jgi:hypothetical protein
MRRTWLVLLAAWATTVSAQSPTNAANQFSLMAPADRLDQLDRFREGLPSSDRSRLDTALPRNIQGGIAQCDKGDQSRASCEAAAYLPALKSTGLMPRFLATLKAKHP